jgi:hypothetical protein
VPARMWVRLKERGTESNLLAPTNLVLSTCPRRRQGREDSTSCPIHRTRVARRSGDHSVPARSARQRGSAESSDKENKQKSQSERVTAYLETIRSSERARFPNSDFLGVCSCAKDSR